MKLWLYGLAMCQSMFCAIPCPWNVWEEKARDKMLLCLPLIGLEIGLLWWLLGWLCRLLQLPMPVTALVLSAFPFLATGYMHLDGFMDVTDAVKSCRSLERRREILKDSHVGSFAVIGVMLLLLAQFAFCAAIKPETDLRILILIPALSRCGSVLAVSLLPKMSTSQYADQAKERKNIAFPVVLALLCLCCGFMLCGRYGLALLGGVTGYTLSLRKAYRSLEGMNGDISGYALTFSELASVAVLALL